MHETRFCLCTESVVHTFLTRSCAEGPTKRNSRSHSRTENSITNHACRSSNIQSICPCLKQVFKGPLCIEDADRVCNTFLLDILLYKCEGSGSKTEAQQRTGHPSESLLSPLRPIWALPGNGIKTEAEWKQNGRNPITSCYQREIVLHVTYIYTYIHKYIYIYIYTYLSLSLYIYIYIYIISFHYISLILFIFVGCPTFVI